MNGDHLDQPTFHERYEAMPPDFRAELIGGIVYVSSPQKLPHGYHHLKLARLADEYVDDTPGTEGCLDSSSILGLDAEPQPDTGIFILPECGGQATIDASEYLCGPPEWIGEISDSTESIDLHGKKAAYEKAGVREYVVAALRSKRVFWFVRRRGKFKPLLPGADGVFRSEVLPGLWLDPAAFLKRDGKRLFQVLREGLASAEHAAFVRKLAAARSARRR
jgi:Uma2 family endonuclease